MVFSYSGTCNGFTLKIAVNDIARTVTGRSRREHISVEALLDSAKMLSVNAMVTAAVAVEACRSCDGDNCGKNPVGSLIFDSTRWTDRPSRATAAGMVKVPLQGHKTIVTAVATIWNSCPELWAARSLGEARRAARNLAKGVPL
jgi:hypothetical protein